MAEEVKNQESQEFHLSPWDLLIAKLNMIEKGQENLERRFTQQIQEIKSGQDKLERQFSQQIQELKSGQEKLEQRLEREIKDVKNEVHGLEQRFDGMDQRFVDEARSDRHNFLVLELTLILGFVTVIITIVGPYLANLIKH